jgi:hypothetical protein
VKPVDRKRRSNIVLLSLIGANCAVIAAAELFPGTEMRRNVYADRADCERDYSPSQCAPANSGGSSSGGGAGAGAGRWFGPAYTADRKATTASGDPGSGRFGLQAATETSIRGGFGSFARAAGRAVG